MHQAHIISVMSVSVGVVLVTAVSGWHGVLLRCSARVLVVAVTVHSSI
jgi:hypothetical protein